ncbi:MAG: hypothetical protein NTZ49_01870 [Candidatus Parcubacteria bacterium]|nr:hypothetical protein [Candidatus Parcubacteria bacterium]
MPIAKDDNLILCTNGDVEDFDPGAIERELESLRQPGYFERHCAPKGPNCCESCRELACPVFG